MVESDKPVEKSSREKIMDEVYTWRIGYNPDLQNDTYGEFKSVFDFVCANYYYFRVIMETSKDKLNHTFTAKFDVPTKVFENVNELTEYSFIIHYDEDGRIGSITWHNITPTDMPYYLKDPVYKLFKLAYYLFTHEKPKDPIHSRANELSNEEIEKRKQEQALEACMVMFKGSLSMDRTIIHNAISQIIKPNHPYETLRLQYTLDENDKASELDTVLKFNTKDAINIVFSKKELYLLVYDVKEEDNTCKHIIGSLKVPFDEYGGIHVYVDGYELKSTVEDNIDTEAYQTIIKDNGIKTLFEIVYQLIYMKERHVWRDFIDHLK